LINLKKERTITSELFGGFSDYGVYEGWKLQGWPTKTFVRGQMVSDEMQVLGKPVVRTIDRGYPFITENGNIILDCDFGIITKPQLLSQKVKQIPGVLEVGIFTRKPDIIYKAKTNGKFEVIT